MAEAVQTTPYIGRSLRRREDYKFLTRTQEEVARAAAVSRSTVSRIERGDRRAVVLLNFD